MLPSKWHDDFLLSLLVFPLTNSLLSNYFSRYPHLHYSAGLHLFSLHTLSLGVLGLVLFLSPHMTITWMLVFALPDLAMIIKLIRATLFCSSSDIVLSTLSVLTDLTLSALGYQCVCCLRSTDGEGAVKVVFLSRTQTAVHHHEEIPYKNSNVLCIFKMFLSYRHHKPGGRKLLPWTDSHSLALWATYYFCHVLPLFIYNSLKCQHARVRTHTHTHHELYQSEEKHAEEQAHLSRAVCEFPPPGP